MNKNIIPFVLLFTSAFNYAQYTDQINTNRPGNSMSGFAVGKTVFQIESGVYGITEKHDVLDYKANGLGVDLQVRYGAIMEELEFIADIQYQFDQYTDALQTTNRNDFRRTTLGAKFLFYDPDKNYKPKVNLYSWKANHKFNYHSLIPAMAVYAGVNLVSKNNPYTFPEDKISPKVMFITHNHFGKWVWVNNIIADKIGTEYPSYGVISTLTRGFNAEWSGFLEYQGYMSDYYGDGIFRVGAAHLIGDTMQVDASISKNIKNTPSILYGGVGFSWRFDLNYREILLPGDADGEIEKSESDKKKQKQKDDAKKRLDEVQPEGN
jgi:hypothetical protein